MRISEYNLGFLGFGHMAQIIWEGLDKAKLIPHARVCFARRSPEKIRQNEIKYGISATSVPHLVEKSDIIILGIRPNQTKLLLEQLKGLRLANKMFITVVAGLPLQLYETYLGPNVPLLRVMPNIASSVQTGMSVFTYGAHAPLEFRTQTHLLFSCLGEVIEVSEDLMDICCGIAGSGPGFVVRLIKAMADIGVKNGLEEKKALKMAAQTFAGAAQLILKGADPVQLIQQIATPNGTTEAGFQMMNKTGIEKSLQEVVEASAKRSSELSSNS